MDDLSTAVIIPTYGAFDYAEQAVRSAYEHTPNVRVFLLDDCSPGWKSKWVLRLTEEFKNFRWHRYDKNKGLTRSWNEGLRWARGCGCAYTIATNSDVLFTPGWVAPIQWALNHGVDLAGPLTNAPGHQPKQQVKRHLPGFRVTDDREYLAEQAQLLAVKNHELFTPLRVNGFCMAAKTTTWWKGAFNSRDVFNPKFKLTRNEDELQGRWKKAGRVSALVPGSLVFHYRGVTRKATRGQEGKGWFRK